MTIDTEIAHYLIVPEITIEAGPHTAWLPSLSQTFLFFMIFQNFSEGLFQLKIEYYFDMLVSTVPPYTALVVPFFDYYRDTWSFALTLRHFVSSKSEAVPVAYMIRLSSGTSKPSLVANRVVLKGLIKKMCWFFKWTFRFLSVLLNESEPCEHFWMNSCYSCEENNQMINGEM